MHAVVAAGLAAFAAGCADDAEPELTEAEYRDRLGSICVTTTATLDALPEPPDAISVAEFATSVADVLSDEAERARALRPPDTLDDDHRAFVRNTDDQAAAWDELATTSTDDPRFGELTVVIGELTLGRDDLSTEMGVAACARDAG